MFVSNDPLGNPVDARHPWNQTTHPQAAETRLQGQVHVGHVAALARQADRRAPGPGHRRRAAGPAVGHGPGRQGRLRLRQGHRPEREDHLAQDRAACPRSNSNGRSPSGATPSSATGPAPTSRPTRPRRRLYFVEKALHEVHAGRTKTWTDFKVPDEAIGCGFHEAVRGVLSHHLVIRDKQDRQLSPLSAHPLERQPPRQLRHARALRGRGAGTRRSSRRTAPITSRGSTSCGPCAASTRACPAACTCTRGDGKLLEVRHVPMFGAYGS